MHIAPATLRTETETLCPHLERLEQQLRAKTIAFDEAKQLWDSDYRPKARTLAEAMLSYVPNNDPGIGVQFQSGDLRICDPDAVKCIEERFLEATACAHLSTVRNQLRKLTRHLPIEAKA
jgi:hypothetical protein